MHPGIVWVHDIGSLDEASARALEVPAGSPWMVMDRADSSLHDRPPTTLSEVLDVALQVLDALSHVHARGVLHRDLKPANLLRFGDRIGLADFGVARWVRDPQQAGRIAGTPLFMAPEQIQDGPVKAGPWSDLYALGWVVWSLLEPHPWEDRGVRAVLMAQLFEAPDPPGPPPVTEWLRRMVAKRPEDRFGTAADARCALEVVRIEVDGASTVGRTEPALPATTFDVHDLDRLELAVADAPTTLDELPAGPRPAMPDDWRGLPEHRPPPLPQVGLGLFQLRAVPLVGRDAERDALWRALRDCREEGVTVALRGPSGMGKTALAHWLVTTARQLGVATAWVTRSPSDPSAADALGELVADGLARSAALPPELDPHARAVLDALARRTHDPVPVSVLEAVHTLRTWIRAVAADRPLVLHIDDAHHARGLLEVMQVIGPVAGVLLLLTIPDEAGAEQQGLEAQLADLEVRTVRVEPLPPADRRRLVARLLGLSDPLADALVRRTDGHPLFAIQLLQDWIDRGLLAPGPQGFDTVPGAELPLPDGLWSTWHDRVDRLVRSDEERAALERAAVLATLAPEIGPSEWEAPGDLRERLLDARLADATPRGGLRLVHGLLREALVRDAEVAGRLAGHHAAVARRVEDPERRGRHLAAAAALAEALAPLTEAARAHLNRDPSRAAELLDLAEAGLGADTPAASRVAFAIARASLALTRGRPDEARRWLDGAVPAATTPALAATLQARRTMLAVRTRGRDAEACVAALAAATDGAEPSLQAMSARWRAEVALIRGDLTGAREVLAPWLERFEHPSTDEGDAWFTWGSIARAAGDFAEARRGYERSLAAYDALGLSTPRIATLGGLADVLRFLGELDEAREAASEMAQVARSRDPAGLAFATLSLAAVDVAAGDHLLASSRLDALLADPAQHPALAATAWAFRLLLCARQGDGAGVDRALTALEERLLDQTHAVIELDVLVACEQAAALLDGQAERAGRAAALGAAQRQGLYG